MSRIDPNSVFSRLKAARKAGVPFVPAPLPEIASTLPTAGDKVTTYESLFEFAHRTGLPADALSALIESGDITHIRLGQGGLYVQVKKALADLERLETAGRSQRSVA